MSDDKDLMYGWFGFKPKVLQKINTPEWYTVFFCLASIFQSTLTSGLPGLTLSSIEKRFGLSSGTSSAIIVAVDISSLLCLFLLSAIAASIHRPRWLSAGLFLCVAGSIVFVIPHFNSPAYNVSRGSEVNDLCGIKNNTCYDQQSNVGSLSKHIAAFVIGRILVGIGHTPVLTIALSYLDDIVTKEKFSFLVGFYYSTTVFGPALGFVGGGFLLRLFVDFNRVDKDKITLQNDDTRWVGAWWMGYLICGGIIFLCTLPLTGYPADMPGAAEIRAKRISEAHGGESESNRSLGLKQVPKLLLGLLTNPVYMLASLTICTSYILTSGFAAFGTKLIQTKFSLPTSLSGALFGAVVIPGGALGTICGALAVNKLNLTIPGMMKLQMLIGIIASVTAFNFWVTCDQTKFAGVNVNYLGQSKNFTSLFDSCNEDCNCTNVDYVPVCGDNKIKYFSPCYAGCTTFKNNTGDDNVKTYENCKCLSKYFYQIESKVTSEPCKAPKCKLMPLFFVLFFLSILAVFSLQSINISVTTRCVKDEHKKIAISFQWIFVRLLGTIPGPIILGKIFDTDCLKWEDRCNKKGSCLWYNAKNLSRNCFFLTGGASIVGLLLFTLAFFIYKPPKPILASKEIGVDSQKESKVKDLNGNTNLSFNYDNISKENVDATNL